MRSRGQYDSREAYRVNKRKMSKMEKRVPEIAVRALNAAHRRAVASGMPMVMMIGDGLYRVSGSGERELIRMLPPQTKAKDLKKRGKR